MYIYIYIICHTKFYISFTKPYVYVYDVLKCIKYNTVLRIFLGGKVGMDGMGGLTYLASTHHANNHALVPLVRIHALFIGYLQKRI